ncbi:hypothetical protein D3C80_2162650 [compost metagenome]
MLDYNDVMRIKKYVLGIVCCFLGISHKTNELDGFCERPTEEGIMVTPKKIPARSEICAHSK